MSPLIHGAVGWLIAQPLQRRRDRMVVTAVAVLPDVDGLGLLVSEDLYLAWHHRLAHGFGAAVVVTVACGLLLRPRGLGALLACLAFHSHIAMDLCGSGPGWPILYGWPWWDGEWLPAWQWDLASWQNSLVGLGTIVGCLSMALRTRRTPVELFSLRADARVVSALRLRFAREKKQP